MRCEWCSTTVKAEHYGLTIHGAAAWMCERHLKKYGIQDAAGDFQAVPADDRLAQIHEIGADDEQKDGIADNRPGG